MTGGKSGSTSGSASGSGSSANSSSNTNAGGEKSKNPVEKHTTFSSMAYGEDDDDIVFKSSKTLTYSGNESRNQTILFLKNLHGNFHKLKLDPEVDSKQCAAVMGTCFRDDAAEWWISMSLRYDTEMEDYAHLEKEFKDQFLEDVDIDEIANKKLLLKQEKNEAVRKYWVRCQTLAIDEITTLPARVQKGANEDMVAHYTRLKFMEGLLPEIKTHLIGIPKEDLDTDIKCRDVARKIEKQIIKKNYEEKQTKVEAVVATQPTTKEDDKEDEAKVEAVRARAQNQGARPAQNKQDITCFNCQRKGHYARDCRSPRRQRSQGGNQDRRGGGNNYNNGSNSNNNRRRDDNLLGTIAKYLYDQEQQRINNRQQQQQRTVNEIQENPFAAYINQDFH